MKNKNELKHTPIQLESLRSELIEKTFSTNSNFLRLSLYQNYFEKILSLNNPNFEEAFLKEFLDDYLACIGKFEVWGIEPGITKKLMEQIKKISILKITSENLTSLNSEIDRVEKQLEKLNLILDGKDFENDETHKAFFPLVDKEAPEGFYGIIESVTVRINKAVVSDKFIIVPSEIEIEKRILEQCKLSWFAALDLSRVYIKKPFKHHEVIISFDKRIGFYEGNSLGIALTLSFLEQILKFYNPAYIINIKEQSAFTGGVTEVGEVLCTSEEIIKRKVAAVFFSEINTFVFPKCEETYAYFTLTQLKKNYPNRKLKLIPVEDINDVLNRRDLVDIRKQKAVFRTAKFVKKNWISAVVTVLLAILFGYLFVVDWDKNPAIINSDGNNLFIKNENGKILWTKKKCFDKNDLNKVAKIVDIDNDGENEILVCGKSDPKTGDILDYSILTCYSAKAKIKWQFKFQDTISYRSGTIPNDYSIKFIDTLTYNNIKSIFLFSASINSFSSAIFRVSLIDGKRLSGTFWASGHIISGIIQKNDTTEQYEIVGLGYDNGYEDAVLFKYDIDSLNSVRPTISEYQITDFPVSKMNGYIRIPKIDYDTLMQSRTPCIFASYFEWQKKNNSFKFAVCYPRRNTEPILGYEIKDDFKNVNIVVNSDFRVARDSLVARRILTPPYTDTKEYVNLLKDKILYWRNGKWSNNKGLEEN